MRRAVQVLPLLAVALAGCPIPQPLPDYPAGAVTPPRILVDDQLGNGAVTLVPANCTTTAPTFQLAARVVDTNTVEGIEARWFVNYDFRGPLWWNVWQRDPVPANGDTTNLVRVLPSFAFDAYRTPPPYGTSATYADNSWPDAGVVRIVELVVSNGFDPGNANTAVPGANRAPKPGFETQYHRWVFLTVPESPSVQCPQ